jgi:hypothetical protein
VVEVEQLQAEQLHLFTVLSTLLEEEGHLLVLVHRLFHME